MGANATAYPCASKRRLQRRDEERIASHPVARMGFFRAQLLRVIDASQNLGESPLHPVTHPNAEQPKTSTSAPARIALLYAPFTILAKKTPFAYQKQKSRKKILTSLDLT